MRRFFEVFKTLKLPEDIGMYMENVEVTRVSKTSTNSLARVYIKNDRVISKKIIYRVEDALKKQIFRIQNMDVRIIDRYNLSKQYTPQTIMDVYYDSILFELEKYWTLEYNLLKNSTWEFEKDDLLVLTLEDGFLARTYADDLKEYFQLIFLNRFGFEIDVEYKYVAKLEKRYEKENEHKLNLRIKQIEDNFMAAGEEAKSDNGAEKNKKYAEQKAKAAAFFNERGASGKDLTRYRKPANTDILYGRDFDDEVTAIEQIESPIGEVVINGMIRSIETREIRNERTILSIVVTDFTDSIVVKMFARNEQLPDLYEFIKKGNFLKIKGIASMDKYDQEITISNVSGIRKGSDNRSVRNDLSLHKRVELHCHTKMSDMDGVSDVKDIVKRAMKWGHKAIAITDHGDVQAFPDANHTVSPDDDFKVIYGVEAYLVDDLKGIVTDSRNQSLQADYVVFDLETTGFSPETNRIIEIGAVKVQNGAIVDRFSTFVNPEVPIPFRIEQLTSIRDDMVIDAPVIDRKSVV